MTFHHLLSEDTYNKDLKINLKKIFSTDEDKPIESAIHKAVTLSVSLALQNKTIIEHAYKYSKDLDENLINAANIAANTMAMNNVYYRATHLINSSTLSQQPAGLRMQGITQHGIDTAVFELMSLAISAINGCGLCLQSHYKQLQSHFNDEQITEALRIASILHALKQSCFTAQTAAVTA